MSSKPPRVVREPVQVYFEQGEKNLLDQLSVQTAIPRAELLRRGLRQLAAELNADAVPGSSMSSLIGALGNSPDVPSDLSEQHEKYLYPWAQHDAESPGGD